MYRRRDRPWDSSGRMASRMWGGKGSPENNLLVAPLCSLLPIVLGSQPLKETISWRTKSVLTHGFREFLSIMAGRVGRAARFTETRVCGKGCSCIANLQWLWQEPEPDTIFKGQPLLSYFCQWVLPPKMFQNLPKWHNQLVPIHSYTCLWGNSFHPDNNINLVLTESGTVENECLTV